MVIVGCGFAGLEAARRLAGAGARLTLIDREVEFIFRPLLSQLLCDQVAMTSVARPLRGFAKCLPDAVFLQGNLDGVDVGARRVLVSGRPITYDYLLLGTGSALATSFPLETPRALRLESLADWRSLDRVIVQTAIGPMDRGPPQGQRSIVVVGGGPHGVELAAAINTRLRTIARKAAPLGRPEVRVKLVHEGSGLLETYPEMAASYAAKALSGLGIEVILNERVGTDGPAIPSTFEALAPTLVWAGGRRAPRLKEIPGLAEAVLDPDLSIRGHPEVLVVGDLAAANAVPSIPRLASAAMQMGHHAALVVSADLSRGSRPTFAYGDHGYGTYLGPHDAVVVFERRVLTGPAAFAAKMALHMTLSTAMSVTSGVTANRDEAGIRRSLATGASRGLIMLERTPPDSDRRTIEMRVESRVAGHTPVHVFDVAVARVDDLFSHVNARILERVVTTEGYIRMRIRLGDWRVMQWPIEVAFDHSSRAIVITTLSTHPFRARATIHMSSDREDTVISQTNRYQLGVAATLLGKRVGLEGHVAKFWRGFHDALREVALSSPPTSGSG